jgi:hypothetical protein
MSLRGNQLQGVGTYGQRYVAQSPPGRRGRAVHRRAKREAQPVARHRVTGGSHLRYTLGWSPPDDVLRNLRENTRCGAQALNDKDVERLLNAMSFQY